MKRLPGEEKGQQQLSVLAPSVWELVLDVCNFGAGLWQACQRERDSVFDV